jgi:HEPN domain-containing protein
VPRGIDPTHWLYRLSPDDWLAAADTELRHAEEKLAARSFRPAITHARRAAGMALNAVLVLQENDRWGRSYMDHVVALVDEENAPDDVRAAAQLLREIPPAPPELIRLGKPDHRALDAARRIMMWCRERAGALRSPPS